MLEDTGDTKVTNFDLAALCHENVLSLQIAMQNFTIMDMLNRQSHLNEPI